MGSISKRGTRTDPKFYVQVKDRDGKYKMRAAKGARTMEDARAFMAKAEARVADGEPAFPTRAEAPASMAELLEAFKKTLGNRNARDDARRIETTLIPHFGKMTIDQVTLHVVMTWLDELAKTPARRGVLGGGAANGPAPGKAHSPTLAGSSRRNLMSLLSRFFSWAIERDLIGTNPVRMVPSRRRPKIQRQRDVPWLQDEGSVKALVSELGPVVGLMFYIGNRSGLRTGEICGLRMSDLDFLHEGVIRVRFSYDGPLKEDRHGIGKLKWAPAPEDLGDVMKLHLARRKLHGAKGEDLVFPFEPPKNQRPRVLAWQGFRVEHVEKCWERACEKLKIHMTWYQATRHSFVSRHLKAGVSLDEVSAAINHSSPAVTRAFYDHYVRKTFSSAMRRGLSGPDLSAPDLEGQPPGSGAGDPGERTG